MSSKLSKFIDIRRVLSLDLLAVSRPRELEVVRACLILQVDEERQDYKEQGRDGHDDQEGTQEYVEVNDTDVLP